MANARPWEFEGFTGITSNRQDIAGYYDIAITVSAATS